MCVFLWPVSMCAGVKVDLHICKEYEHYYAIHPRQSVVCLSGTCQCVCVSSSLFISEFLVSLNCVCLSYAIKRGLIN